MRAWSSLFFSLFLFSILLLFPLFFFPLCFQLSNKKSPLAGLLACFSLSSPVSSPVSLVSKYFLVSVWLGLAGAQAGWGGLLACLLAFLLLCAFGGERRRTPSVPLSLPPHHHHQPRTLNYIYSAAGASIHLDPPRAYHNTEHIPFPFHPKSCLLVRGCSRPSSHWIFLLCRPTPHNCSSLHCQRGTEMRGGYKQRSTAVSSQQSLPQASVVSAFDAPVLKYPPEPLAASDADRARAWLTPTSSAASSPAPVASGCQSPTCKALSHFRRTPSSSSSSSSSKDQSSASKSASPSSTKSKRQKQHGDVTTELANFFAAYVRRLWLGQPFDSRSRSTSPFGTFVYDLLKATSLSNSVVVLAIRYIYMLSLRRMNPAGPWPTCFADGVDRSSNLDALDEKTLFVAALMVAMKSPNGCCNTFTNQTWSKVSKLPLKLLNSAEMNVCLRLGFDMWTQETDYMVWIREVELSAIEFHYGSSERLVEPLLPPLKVVVARSGKPSRNLAVPAFFSLPALANCSSPTSSLPPTPTTPSATHYLPCNPETALPSYVQSQQIFSPATSLLPERRNSSYTPSRRPSLSSVAFHPYALPPSKLSLGSSRRSSVLTSHATGPFHKRQSSFPTTPTTPTSFGTPSSGLHSLPVSPLKPLSSVPVKQEFVLDPTHPSALGFAMPPPSCDTLQPMLYSAPAPLSTLQMNSSQYLVPLVPVVYPDVPPLHEWSRIPEGSRFADTYQQPITTTLHQLQQQQNGFLQQQQSIIASIRPLASASARIPSVAQQRPLPASCLCPGCQSGYQAYSWPVPVMPNSAITYFC
ncbi:hypothetical protein DFJ73DRAFT_1857 [Zopfochytrium polystomum]|nr:hypothetical protein DFJ73DRAFT_1857 [Zopfochytrium polystomum]